MKTLRATNLLFVLLWMLWFVNIGQTAKILNIAFLGSKSHKNVYEPLLMELAKRGHDMTIVTAYPSGKPVKNVREISIPDRERFESMIPNFFEMKEQKKSMNPFVMGKDIFGQVCHHAYEQPPIRALLKEKFDLVIYSAIFNECLCGFINELNTSSILITTIASPLWISGVFGSPSPASFVPNPVMSFSHEMSFYERVLNFLANVGLSAAIQFLYVPQMEAIYRQHVNPNAPSVHDVFQNASLVLSNGHFVLNYPRPLMPDIIDVGGMHCRSAQPLPKDLEEFLKDTDEDGFIYFSMGSVTKGSQMPEKYRKAFVNAFSKLKQKVVWKWETETMPDTPKNVKLSKWLPQQDILGHPNIRLFITHGGLLSTQEAVFHGVPLIGIPMFGDQLLNMEQSEKNGFAITLQLDEVDEHTVSTKIQRILIEPKFATTAKSLSKIFRDQPESPLERAVFWTEYVLRHKGAMHLRSPARELNFFQYHSIDVIAVFVAAIWMIIQILKFAIKKLCSCCFSNKTKQVSRKKKGA